MNAYPSYIHSLLNGSSPSSPNQYLLHLSNEELLFTNGKSLMHFWWHPWAHHVGELVPVSQLGSIEGFKDTSKNTIYLLYPLWRGETFLFLLLKLFSFARKAHKKSWYHCIQKYCKFNWTMPCATWTNPETDTALSKEWTRWHPNVPARFL